MSKDLKQQVEQILNKVRPGIQMHGGDVELWEIKDGVVKLKITGSCVGCPMSSLTFDMGVGKEIKKIRGVKKVEYR